MTIRFKTLFQLEIAHGYYDGPCRDFEFVLLPGEPLLVAGKLLARERDGHLVVLFESDSGGAALRNVAGQTLLIGLRARNPALANFTAPPVASGAPVFANTQVATAFDAALAGQFLAPAQRVVPQQIERPLILSWQQGAVTVEERTLQASDSETTFATGEWPDGRYTLRETAVAAPRLTHWLKAPAWAGEGLWGVAAVTIDADFYATAPTLQVSLQARSEVLSYFVVARNFGATEFNQIQFNDAGAAEQKRPPLVFDRILPSNSMLGDMPLAALGESTARFVLFQSRSPVPRRAGGYRKLQLRRSTEVLVQHLPQAATDRAQARFIVHLAKS